MTFFKAEVVLLTLIDFALLWYAVDRETRGKPAFDIPQFNFLGLVSFS